MKEKFKSWKPSAESSEIIIHITTILEEYRNQGYNLTLRQLYYQLVSRDIIPNTVGDYNRIGNIVSNGRMAGMIDWDMIEDRVRIPEIRTHWDSPREILEVAKNTYYKSRWETQQFYIEVWCEKDAISNIIIPVCREYDVPFMANRGYSSQSAMYEAAQRINTHLDQGKSIRIIYLGDHDPSGIDMTRDIDDRLGLFTRCGSPLGDVQRIALNRDQIDEFNPPKNPAKITDSRYEKYVEVYGESSWELDALNPRTLDSLVREAITAYIDEEEWEKIEQEEAEQQEMIQDLIDKF